MSVFHKIAEELIQDAMRKGEFDNLEGAGKPLQLEDDSMIPEDLRMAYRLLKNSGFVPPEILEEREIKNVMDLLEKCEDESERYRQMQKLNYMITQINMKRRRPINLEKQQQYYDKAVEKTSLNSKKDADEESE